MFSYCLPMPGSSILESSVIMKIFRLEFGHDMSDMLIELDLKLIKKFPFLYKARCGKLIQMVHKLNIRAFLALKKA